MTHRFKVSFEKEKKAATAFSAPLSRDVLGKAKQSKRVSEISAKPSACTSKVSRTVYPFPRKIS